MNVSSIDEKPSRVPITDLVSKKQIPVTAEQDAAPLAVSSEPPSEKVKAGTPSIDGRTLNDPDELLKEEREATRAAIHDPDPNGKDEDFPDGGLRAWLVVFGGFCVTFASFGFVNTWGAFQAYYEQTLLQNNTASNIAWIGSIQYALTFLPSIITGRLFDLGYFKFPLYLSSCLLILATFLTAQCKEYWQFLLCQGIAVGLASGLIFGPTLAAVSHWFKRRRGTALGLVACGSSTGGTVFPIVFRNLVFKIGFPWTMRVLAFILLVVLSMASLTLDRRLPPVNVSGGLFNLRAFKSKPYATYTLAGFISFLGLYTLLTYIDVSATVNGVDSSFSFYLLSIANAASFFGRLGGGVLADKIGAINVMSPATFCAGILTYVWPFVHGKASYVIVAILYGCFSGAFVGLLAAPMIALGDTDDVGRRTGMYMTVLASGAVAGPPISGAINVATGGYTIVGIYAGTMVVLSVAVMWTARCMVLKSFWGKF